MVKGVIGRPKGTPNKFTQDMKAMIQEAFEKAGGVDYLVEQAHDNPKAFMGLIGKILPTHIQAELTISLGDLEQRLMEGRKQARGEIIDAQAVEVEIIKSEKPAIDYAEGL